jgi:hypothetical protein
MPSLVEESLLKAIDVLARRVVVLQQRLDAAEARARAQNIPDSDPDLFAYLPEPFRARVAQICREDKQAEAQWQGTADAEVTR